MPYGPVLALLVTIVIGAIGGILLFKLKVPTGAMIGSMTLVLIFGLTSGKAYFPTGLRQYVQIASGILIGCRIQEKDIREFKNVVIPSLLLLLGMFSLNLLFAFLFTKIGGLDINTSLFAAAPGGMSDMALIAEALGANTAQVAMLQLVRILIIVSLFPPVFKYLASRGWRLIQLKKDRAVGDADSEAETGNVKPADPAAQGSTAGEKPGKHNSRPGTSFWNRSAFLRINLAMVSRFLLTIALATGGGLVFNQFGVPAGAMIGSMLATAAWSILSGKAFFPTRMRLAIQIMVGAFLGARMTLDSLISLRNLAVPALIMMAGLILMSLGYGHFIHRITGLETSTCLMASTPGGLAEMSLIAEDLGADAPKVAVMHTFRMAVVILLFPMLLKILSLILT